MSYFFLLDLLGASCLRRVPPHFLKRYTEVEVNLAIEKTHEKGGGLTAPAWVLCLYWVTSLKRLNMG